MFKHAAVVVVAVLVALVTAKQLTPYPGAAAEARPQVETAVAPATDTTPVSPAAGAPAEISKASDGHYWAEAEVDGHWMRCLVDTGATVVALRREDAIRLGLNPAALTYDAAVNTANGQTRAARVELDHVSVSGARVDHVQALVVADGLPAPLLGMSYLGRLSRFEATPTTLILRP